MWVWVDDPKDTLICKAKRELIGNVISFLENDTDNGIKALDDYNLLKLIKLMFDTTKYLTFTAPVDAQGKNVTSATPINITIAPKA